MYIHNYIWKYVYIAAVKKLIKFVKTDNKICKKTNKTGKKANKTGQKTNKIVKLIYNKDVNIHKSKYCI